MSELEGQLATSQFDLSQRSAELESQTVTITTLNMSLQTEMNKIQALEESLQVQQQHLQQAITSPTLLRHTPLKKKGSNVKMKVEEYEHHLLKISSGPSTRK